MLAGSEHLLTTAFLFAPVYLATHNPLLAANLATMATYVLAAAIFYAALRRFGLPVAAAAAGAVACALAPLRLPADVHVVQYSNWTLCLLLLAIAARAGTSALATAAILAFFSSYYLAAMAGLLIALEACRQLSRGDRGAAPRLLLAGASGGRARAVLASVRRARPDVRPDHRLPWSLAAATPLRALRGFSRFVVLAHLGVAGLAADGTAILTHAARRLPHRLGAAASAVAGAIVVTTIALPRAWKIADAPRASGSVGERVPPVYRWLASHGDGPLLELPAPGWGPPLALRQAEAMYGSLFHWLPLLNGHTAFRPWWFEAVVDEAAWLLDPGALQALVDLTGVRYLLVRRDPEHPASFAGWERPPTLAPAVTRIPLDDPDLLLLRIGLRPRRPWREALAIERNAPGRTRLGAPLALLAEGNARGRVQIWPVPTTVSIGRPLNMLLRVENQGGADWPGLLPPAQPADGLVLVAARWQLESAGTPWDAAPIRLPRDVAAGDRVRSWVSIPVPAEPGRYTLTLALTQVGGASFAGGTPAIHAVEVVRATP